MRKNDQRPRQAGGATRTSHARARLADHPDHPDHPDPYRRQQLAIWAVAEATRKRCAHRG
jgi:hypothetical protein